jgi:hypothetical protein
MEAAQIVPRRRRLPIEACEIEAGERAVDERAANLTGMSASGQIRACSD